MRDAAMHEHVSDHLPQREVLIPGNQKANHPSMRLPNAGEKFASAKKITLAINRVRTAGDSPGIVRPLRILRGQAKPIHESF
jgi:hypothetical protein